MPEANVVGTRQGIVQVPSGGLVLGSSRPTARKKAAHWAALSFPRLREPFAGRPTSWLRLAYRRHRPYVVGACRRCACWPSS